jgi:hypothetical protein
MPAEVSRIGISAGGSRRFHLAALKPSMQAPRDARDVASNRSRGAGRDRNVHHLHRGGRPQILAEKA